MIEKLTTNHHEQVMNFLMEEPSLNLFIIGDIESFGYDSDFQELWGEFDSEGNLNGVLLRYYNSYIPYGKGNFDIEGFINILKKNPGFMLSGIEEIIDRFEDALDMDLGKKQVTYFCECTNNQFPGIMNNSPAVKKAEIEDIDRIISLRDGIEEFISNSNVKEMMRKSMETKTGRTYYFEVDGEMVASASTTAENTLSAMIVGVCTGIGHRKKGYATQVMEKLMDDVFAENKTLCLFYDNPEAGRIYKRLGFKDIGMWTMYRRV